MRNRRYTTRKGPLVVYSEDSGIVRAFRNIPGVDVARVDRLNLLQVTAGMPAPSLLRVDACRDPLDGGLLPRLPALAWQLTFCHAGQLARPEASGSLQFCAQGLLCIVSKPCDPLQTALGHLSTEDVPCMQLAPGGHLGRFIIWTRSAFDRLDEVFGEQPNTEGHLDSEDWHALCLKGLLPTVEWRQYTFVPVCRFS